MNDLVLIKYDSNHNLLSDDIIKTSLNQLKSPMCAVWIRNTFISLAFKPGDEDDMYNNLNDLVLTKYDSNYNLLSDGIILISIIMECNFVYYDN